MSSYAWRIEKRNRRYKCIVIGICTFIAVGAVGRQAWRYREYKQEVNATRLRIEQLQQQHQQLLKEHEKLHTSEYVEKIAREEYNMVGKNEVPIFIVEDKKNK